MKTRILRLTGALLASCAWSLAATAQNQADPSPAAIAAAKSQPFPVGVARTSGPDGWWATEWTSDVGSGFEGEPLNAPADDVLVRHGYYTASYDIHRRITIWAAHSVDKATGLTADGGTRPDKPHGDFNRPSVFSVEPLVKEAATAAGLGIAKHDDYTAAEDPRYPVPSGLDPKKLSGNGRYMQRGHIVPNDAMKCVGDVLTGIKAQKETFSLANIVPETNDFNAPTWFNLEMAVLKWAEQYDRIWVIGGPIVTSHPSVDMEGIAAHDDRHVVVPDSMFYVILVKDHGQARTAAFIIPNRPEKLDYRDYTCSVADVEKACGLNFFPQLGYHPPTEQEKGSWIFGPN